MKALLTKMCLGRYLQQKVDTYSKNQSTSFFNFSFKTILSDIKFNGLKGADVVSFLRIGVTI